MSYQASQNPREDLRERLYLPELLRGLAITTRHFIRNLFGQRDTNASVVDRKGTNLVTTVQYPEERVQYPEGYRGLHRLVPREDGKPRCVACYMCATICPAECIYIEAGEHPNPEIEKFPERFDIDMMRCIYCGFCVDACPEEAIIMSREHHQSVYNREETIYSIEKLMARPGIDAKGPGYRPNRPMAEAAIFDKKTQNACPIPSTIEERHPAVLYESMIRKRQ
jgi:NADH-quinone oxidoreductase subunit I